MSVPRMPNLAIAKSSPLLAMTLHAVLLKTVAPKGIRPVSLSTVIAGFPKCRAVGALPRG